MPAKKKLKPLFEGSEWDFATLQRVYDAIQDVALNDLGLDIYPNQIEIISSGTDAGRLFVGRLAG